MEAFIQGKLADQVAKGFEALIVEEDAEVVAVAAHEARPDPAGSGSPVTYLIVAAIRLDRQGSMLEDGTKLSDAVMGLLVADALATAREPYIYGLVATDNLRSRRICERIGLTAESVRPHPDYIYYSAWFDDE